MLPLQIGWVPGNVGAGHAVPEVPIVHLASKYA